MRRLIDSSVARSLKARSMSHPAKIVLDRCGIVWIPRKESTCPECNAQLYAEIFEWESDSGKPTWAGVAVSCCKEEEWVETGNDDLRQRGYQSDWQPVLELVIPWCQANVRIRDGEL